MQPVLIPFFDKTSKDFLARLKEPGLRIKSCMYSGPSRLIRTLKKSDTSLSSLAISSFISQPFVIIFTPSFFSAACFTISTKSLRVKGSPPEIFYHS